MDYTTYCTIPETSSHYESLRMLRKLSIYEQHQIGRQEKSSASSLQFAVLHFQNKKFWLQLLINIISLDIS